MSKLNTALNLLRGNPLELILALERNNLLNWLPDKTYLRLMNRVRLGKRLDLENPITYSDKLQWLKLYDRRPEYTIYADKYAVRDFYEKTIGSEYVIPLIGVYNRVEEIPWEELPNQFVLKCTHSSGANIVCRNKRELDVEQSKRNLQRWLKKNYYWHGREWPYKNIDPLIICEEYMIEESGEELKDYKIYCFNGEPKLIEVHYNRYADHKSNLYDIQWNYVTGNTGYPSDPNITIVKPNKLGEMLYLSRKLANNYPHMRVDFYYTGEKLYIGELTLFPGSGLDKMNPPALDIEMGNWIRLPNRMIR